MKYCGEHLDIHCGGIDNAFPHHTNEIAQSEAYLGHKWCNYWFHVLHLNTNSGKMSKSAGEFLTVSLLESRGYDPLAYRFFCLQSHYRKSLLFTYENLDNAAAAYGKLVARIAALKPDAGESDPAAEEALRTRFTDALNNDLNTSLAVTALYDVLKAKIGDGAKLRLIAEFDRVLSLGLMEAAERVRAEQAKQAQPDNGLTGELADYVNAQIAARAAAKKAKNYAEADRIRDELKSRGILLEDTPSGVRVVLA